MEFARCRSLPFAARNAATLAAKAQFDESASVA
jgi:hypothetical protein